LTRWLSCWIHFFEQFQFHDIQLVSRNDFDIWGSTRGAKKEKALHCELLTASGTATPYWNLINQKLSSLSYGPLTGDPETESQRVRNNACHLTDPHAHALHSWGVNVPCVINPLGVLLDDLKNTLRYGHLVHWESLLENSGNGSHPCNIKKCARPETQEDTKLSDF
jgi:hypothetical protein